MPDRPRIDAIVLAAGAGSRFGGAPGAKLLAPLDGRPILGHVLDAAAAAHVARVVVVVPPDHAALGAALDGALGRGAALAVNPDPASGLASSLQTGWRAILASEPGPAACLILLGDQPRVPAAALAALLDAPLDPARPVVAPRYRDGGGPNPVRLEPAGGWLVAEAAGDHGLGPLLPRHPELVRWIDVEGSNPDVDRPEDLADLSAARTRP